jgi:hypothetical protein
MPSNVNLVALRMKDVNLPKFKKICKFVFPQFCNFHSELGTSVQLSIKVRYTFSGKENQTVYSVQHVLTFASQLIYTKLINILIPVHRLISSCVLISNCMLHTVVLLKRQLSERMNDWI